MRFPVFITAAVIGFCSLVTIAQQPAPKSLAAAEAERFKFGKSMYVRNERANSIAFDTINSDLQGWGHFVPASSPEKADLIVEVTSIEGGGVSMSSKTDYGMDGKPSSSSKTSKDLSASSISMKVLEARTKRELWLGTERVKSAFKKKAGEDNILAAAEKLFKRFHDYVEPPSQ
jgi:hypothetical protein